MFAFSVFFRNPLKQNFIFLLAFNNSRFNLIHFVFMTKGKQLCVCLLSLSFVNILTEREQLRVCLLLYNNSDNNENSNSFNNNIYSFNVDKN